MTSPLMIGKTKVFDSMELLWGGNERKLTKTHLILNPIHLNDCYCLNYYYYYYYCLLLMLMAVVQYGPFVPNNDHDLLYNIMNHRHVMRIHHLQNGI